MEDTKIHIHDVLIIGAGPCGLAVAARLREKTPSALFTDSEHQRYHWMKASASSRRNTKPTKISRRPTAQDRLLSGSSLRLNDDEDEVDIAVLDANGDSWMSAWNDDFDRLKIGHLRSPMFFHPDPRDRDGLLGFAYAEGREHELREIPGVVGKGLSKYQRKKSMKKTGTRGQETTYLDERSRPDYYRPSASLFRAYCADVTCRYNLSSIVEKSEVMSVKYCSDASIFTLQTSTGTRKARIVVFAAGAASNAAIPPTSPFHTHPQGSVAHAFEKCLVPSSHILLSTHVLSRIAAKKQTNVIVIGGGLSSAQVSYQLSKSGVTKVWHLMRGCLKVKHFDVDLSWVGKYKNFELASFWSADSDEERAEMLRDARGGGSVTPDFKRILLSLVAKGLVELREHTFVSGAEWDEKSQTWHVETDPPMELPRIDHVIYATGYAPDWDRIALINPLSSEYPMKTVGGMPCLTNDLMWNEDVPFFVTGRLAGLRIGPGAGNLEGARQGSERVSWKIAELLKDGVCQSDSGYGSDWDQRDEVDRRRLGLGIENQFGILDLDCDN